jgi:hypothetical protein
MARPSKRGSIDMQQMGRLYLAGWTDQQVADFFKITRTTIEHWKAKDDKFFNTLKDWKIQADHAVEQSLYKSACGFSRMLKKAAYDKKTSELNEWEEEAYYPPNATSIIFWLKNRKPALWRDKRELEHSGELDMKLKSIIKEAVPEINSRIQESELASN